MGFLKKDGAGEDWTIPIYGVDNMRFVHETVWDFKSSIANPLISTWQGDKPVQFNFQFELVAGLTAINRNKLFEYVRIAHALNAGTYEQGKPGVPPPPCLFALGSYVLCRGVLENITAEVSGPWSGDGFGETSAEGIADMAPTFAKFSGLFTAVASYKWNDQTGGMQIVNVDQKRFSSNDIRQNFYKSA